MKKTYDDGYNQAIRDVRLIFKHRIKSADFDARSTLPDHHDAKFRNGVLWGIWQLRLDLNKMFRKRKARKNKGVK